MALQMTSTAFNEGKIIPPEYTCDGRNISPPLAWSGIPNHTKSLALICDDPDAPAGTWVHWVIYDIPPGISGLDENVLPLEILANNSRQGINDFRKTGYGGPCPPGGTHRYIFKLYALDIMIKLNPDIQKQELLEAMEGHILEQTRLTGTYTRQK